MSIMAKPLYISVIIPSLNRPMALRQSLNSVLKQDTDGIFEYEVIIVLDNKDKESGNWLKDEILLNRRIKFFRSPEPGVNSARNAGIKESRGEIIYFLDDDCYFLEKRQLLNLRASFNAHPEASAIGGGYILEDKGKDVFSISRNKLDNFHVEDTMSLKGETGALLGGNTAYKKEVFIKYGFFDENIHFGAAETELNDRILKGGGKLHFLKELSLMHSTGRHGLIKYFLKAFMQGRGKGYSIAKNGKLRLNYNNKPEKIWFMRISAGLNANLPFKVIAAAFIFLNSVCYQLGKLAGIFYYYPMLKMHGK
ncbi:MAG: glycosyltransferase family A protein [Candidatus Omnitrophota bacterium]